MKQLSILLLATTLLGGCASTSDVDRLRAQISELQEQLATVKRTASSKEDVQNVNQRIVNQTELLLQSNAKLVAKVDEMDQRIQTAQGSVEQATYRMDQLAQQMTQAQRDIESLKTRADAAAVAAAPPPVQTPMTSAPAMPSPPPAAAAATPVPTQASREMTVTPAQSPDRPIDVYNAAYRDYQLANYDLAISGFKEFLAQNANSDLADNAAYWIGESLFSQKKYRDAIEQFDSVVTRYPKSDKVPAALLKKGYAYINLSERAQGIVQLQYVVHEHPNSAEAALARQRLRQLGVETR